MKTADLIFPFQKASYCAYISEEEHPETSLRRLAIGKLKGIIMMTTRDMQPRWTMQVWLPDVSLKAVKARQVAQVEWVVGSPLPADGSCWGSRVWTWAEREQQTYKTRNHPCVQMREEENKHIVKVEGVAPIGGAVEDNMNKSGHQLPW